MKRISRESLVAIESAETHSPLWIINAMLAIFFVVAAILIAWG